MSIHKYELSRILDALCRCEAPGRRRPSGGLWRRSWQLRMPPTRRRRPEERVLPSEPPSQRRRSQPRPAVRAMTCLTSVKTQTFQTQGPVLGRTHPADVVSKSAEPHRQLQQRRQLWMLLLPARTGGRPIGGRFLRSCPPPRRTPRWRWRVPARLCALAAAPHGGTTASMQRL